MSDFDGTTSGLEKTILNDTEDSDILHQLHSNPEGPPLQEVIPLLLSSTEELRFACAVALYAIRVMLEAVNSGRYNFTWWRGNRDGLDMEKLKNDLDTSRDRLHAAIENFTSVKRLEILELYMPHVHLMQQQKRNVVARSLIIASLFQANLLASANGITRLLNYVASTIEKRKRNRLWIPTGVTDLWKVITSRGGGDDSGTGAGIDDTEKMLGEDDRVDDVEKRTEDKYSTSVIVSFIFRKNSNNIFRRQNVIQTVYHLRISSKSLLI